MSNGWVYQHPVSKANKHVNSATVKYLSMPSIFLSQKNILARE